MSHEEAGLMVPGFERRQRANYGRKAASVLQKNWRQLVKEAGFTKPKPGISKKLRQDVWDSYKDFYEWWQERVVDVPFAELVKRDDIAERLQGHTDAYRKLRNTVIPLREAKDASTRTIKAKNIFRAPKEGESWTDVLKSAAKGTSQGFGFGAVVLLGLAWALSKMKDNGKRKAA